MGADRPDGEGPRAQGAAAVGASGDDGAQSAAADGAPISGDGPATAEVAVAAPALAISDLIRSAADQASATWRNAALPTQRRESPATPLRSVAAPALPALAPAEPQREIQTRAETASVGLPAPAPPAAESPTPATQAADTEAVAGTEAEAEALADAHTVTDVEAEDAHWPGARRQIALLTTVVCVLILAVLLGHRYLPNVLGLGSLLDTFLPWTAAPLLLALPAALLSLKKRTIGICLLTCAVWAGTFAPTLVRSGGSGPADIRVLSQNVSSGAAEAPDLSGVARLADQRGADIVVLQGLSKNIELADQAVPARYPFHIAMYEFVVWSRFPIGSSRPVDLAGDRRADQAQSAAAAVDSSSGSFGGLLEFTVNAGRNRQVTVYAVHLPQPSLSHDGFGVSRGGALEQLVDDVQAEKSPNLIVVGDLDVAQTDRAMRPLLGSSTGLVSAQAKAGSGFGFTWPATFPVVRLDDVLTRGLKPVASAVLPAVGPQQAHRPIEADLKF